MNDKICNELVRLGIFTSRVISEEEYHKCKETDAEGAAIYYEASYDNGGYYLNGNDNASNGGNNKWYKRIDTRGLSLEDVKLQLEIEQTKAVISIKKMVLFFVVIAVIALAFSFVSGVSLLI